jgi:hypothetical protein
MWVSVVWEKISQVAIFDFFRLSWRHLMVLIGDGSGGGVTSAGLRGSVLRESVRGVV